MAKYLLLFVLLVGCTSRQPSESDLTLPAEEACRDAQAACLEQSRVLGCMHSTTRCNRCTWEGEVPAERSMLCADGWLRADTCEQLNGIPEACWW